MIKRFYIMAATLFCLAASCTQEPTGKTVYLKDYLTEEMLCDDAEPAIRKALEECLNSNGSTLVLPGGTLHIKPDFATVTIRKSAITTPVTNGWHSTS